MTKTLQQHERRAIQQEQTQLGKLFSFKDKKACYRKNYLGWDNIERVNQPKYRTKKTKYLNKQALAVMAAIVPKLERGERVIFNHKYLSSITLCKRRQNQNIIQELKIVLDIEYHNSVTHNGKKYRHSYEFLYKQQKQENISSPENSIGQFFARQTASIHIYKKNKDIEYIDLKSNFLQNSQSEKIEENPTSELPKFLKTPLKNKKCLLNQRKKSTNQERKARIYSPKFKQYDQPKSLGEHYPLTTEECSELQSRSGREFTINAMNEILLDMSRKTKESRHKFPSKAAFMAYMSKVYRYEGRDAEKTANTGFKILARASKAEIIQHTTQTERESYLNLIEQQAITHRSDENQLKAKWASTLPTNSAYNFLSNMRIVRKVGKMLEILMDKEIELSKYSREIILAQAQAVGGFMDVERLDILIK